ncbi:ribonuclease H-like domain-containing protein [Tanacetum coccineum]|uniref:Ribonuclease H-like domain-containing protein n=1 Tax=Tanacetum coccineum TaxID=301880 RepID=A0ABQ4ZUT7_9ASTR
MALPNKDQLKFHSYQDAKLLMEAIEKRYGGNKESKKVQRTLLKQQYENFAALSSESMDQTFDRLQKLISQLEIQGEVISQEDMNLKLLRSLPSEWKTHALIWRNKVEIETISLDDLYNNLKIYEPELTGSSSTSQNSQNVAFVSNSTNNTNNTNKADSTTHRVSTTHTQEDLEHLHPDDLEEMDLQSDMAMLTIRSRRFIKRTRRKLHINGQRVGFDKSTVECYNCHKHGHFARECRFPRNQENKGREKNSRTIPIESPNQNALIAQDGIGGYDWSYQAEEEQPTNHALMAFASSRSSSSSDSESLNDLLESQVIDKFKTGLGYTAATPAVVSFVNLTNKSGSDKGYQSVPSPLLGNFIPHKPDLTFIDEIVESENLDVTTVVTPYNAKTIENKGVSNTVESNTVRMNITSAPIIENWNSDDESEIDYTVRPSTEKIKSIKTVRETDAPKQNKHHPRGNQRNWNNLMSQRLGSDFKMINKACYVCGSFEHLHYVCDKKVVRPVWNNSRRVNHKNFSNKMTHPHPKRSFVPQAVLTRTGKINTAGTNVNTAGASINTVIRPINTAASTPIVNHPRPKSNAYKRGYSQSSRPFNRYYANKNKNQLHFANKNSVINTNVNTARVKHTTARVRAVIQVYNGLDPQKGNKYYLDEYEDYDGRFVSFGDGKGKISSKGKIKIRSLDFEDVNFLDFLVLIWTTRRILGILKTFLTEIENQLDKVKVIRCDNGTEFKNSIMNQFCEMKGIKREFSVARTPQHNGVAERKNRTLIETTRTMLVDSKLPTTFWAEVVNTVCYVLNRVLVIKP